MQTLRKTSRKHGEDANPRRVFEKTRSGCKPMDFPRTASLCFFERILASYPCFYAYSGSWKLNPRTSSPQFYACFLGDSFGGSILGVPRENPPLPGWRFGHIAAFHTCFYACFANRPARGPAERGGGRGKPPHPMLVPVLTRTTKGRRIFGRPFFDFW